MVFERVWLPSAHTVPVVAGMLFWAAHSHHTSFSKMFSLLGDGMDCGHESLDNVKAVMQEAKQLVGQEALVTVLSELLYLS